jgi:large conductance mechanosensitive channel
MFRGFREFILHGNVLDLAVGVIIGASFGTVVTSLATDVLTPIIGLIFGQPNFSAMLLGPVKIGNLLNALISFLITAAALYFFVVAPINALNERMRPKVPVPTAAPTRTCPDCLSSVPAAARRCAFCTSSLVPA